MFPAGANDPSQNMLTLFHLLGYLPFITSEMAVNDYHQKLNVRVASQVTK